MSDCPPANDHEAASKQPLATAAGPQSRVNKKPQMPHATDATPKGWNAQTGLPGPARPPCFAPVATGA
jgi:hypothetical protein